MKPQSSGPVSSPNTSTTFNKLPIANAGPDQTVFLANGQEQWFVLDGSKSSDGNGKIKSYMWTQIEGPNLDLWTSGPGESGLVVHSGPPVSKYPTVRLGLPMLSSNTTFKFSLKVKDDKGVSNNPAIVTISVKDKATPPTTTNQSTPPTTTNQSTQTDTTSNYQQLPNRHNNQQ